MRSKLIIVVTLVTGFVLAAQMAVADQVQEQLRLMEQRMAEMEDRLQATSEELRSAKATVDEQQNLLTDAGLVDEEDKGIRSAVGKFLEQVDINGVVAASYNYRFAGPGDANLENVGLFRHPSADTFALDQVWITLDKSPTEEDRAGFHVDLVGGVTAQEWFGNSDSTGGGGGSIDAGDTLGIFTGYVSYLAPIGNGVQLDAGKLATPFGGEVLQTNKNFNITQGLVWGLQPVTHTGIQLSGDVTDGVTLTGGVVNDVYSDTSFDDSRDKAYYGQVAFSGDKFGVKVGAIVGKDSSSDYVNEQGNICKSGDECMTSVFNVVATANPSDNVSLWADLTWLRAFGDDIDQNGDVHGFAVAGRVGITEDTGIATRIEYVRSDHSYNNVRGSDGGTGQVMSYTLTGDHALTDSLTFRLEGRLDQNLANNPYFAIGSNNDTDTIGTRDFQFVGLAELFYEF